MDFITRLLKVQGKDCIFVIVDRFTKFSHFFVIPSTSSTTQIIDLFFKEVFILHGLPKTIISDKDTKFTNASW